VSTDERFLQTAARLAWRGAGRTAPNPMVGCVIVAPSGEIIGMGHHRAFGGPHAEVEALASCARQGRDPRGATAYVTLEPCSHFGKTPPCADALLGAGVAEVVAAERDLGERSSGGFDRLRERGVRVRLVREPAASIAHRSRVIGAAATGVWTVCKWAQTIDGFSATRSGESQWISGERSRRFVHRLRGRVDAILVGIGTVLADDPMLTARGVRVRRAAKRVVVDRELRLPLESRLVRTARDVSVIVYASEESARGERSDALRRAGVVVEAAPSDASGRLKLDAVLRSLADDHGVANALCEAGARLTGTLVREGLADELLVFTGPMAFGDPAARPALETGETPALADAPRFSLTLTRRVGDDVMSLYSRAGSSPSDGAASPGARK